MPWILRVLTSRVLACGCLVGVYETYDGRIVQILDAHSDRCPDTRHAAGTAGDLEASDPAAPKATLLAS
jgi:hypothetical protein